MEYSRKRQIVNIVNFVRAVEPRCEVDLVGTVRQQIRLLDEYHLPATFLLQYDALVRPEYVDLMKSLDPERYELGIWYEIVRPLTEDSGIPWRGKTDWDWHTDCGFSVGYPTEERIRLVDTAFEKFRELFGYFPRVFGSWLFDSETAAYVSRKYDCDAFCNCKEQFGTDGYTLWGGYYGQGYYPARDNVFLPANRPENRLSTPLFRMLAADPVRQYDFGLSPELGSGRIQGVVTLEPVYPEAGGSENWVDWYLRENFNGECLSFGYAQAGQENSFGWQAMEKGLRLQFERFCRLSEAGQLEIETLGQTGRWYRASFSDTPLSLITAHSAYDDPEVCSVWASSKYYRVNFYGDRGSLRIRDFQIFDDRLIDDYLESPCRTKAAIFRALPVIDGNLFSGGGILAGGFFRSEKVPALPSELTFEELGDGRAARLGYGGYTVDIEERGFTVASGSPFSIEIRYQHESEWLPELLEIGERRITLSSRGVEYSIELERGSVASSDGSLRICSEGSDRPCIRVTLAD